MINRKHKIILWISFCVICVIGVYLVIPGRVNVDYVRSTEWIYDKGFKIGDYIKFDQSYYSLRNDTILRQGIPCAKIKSSSKLFDEIKIESLDDKRDVGTYLNLNADEWYE